MESIEIKADDWVKLIEAKPELKLMVENIALKRMLEEATQDKSFVEQIEEAVSSGNN